MKSRTAIRDCFRKTVYDATNARPARLIAVAQISPSQHIARLTTRMIGVTPDSSMKFVSRQNQSKLKSNSNSFSQMPTVERACQSDLGTAVNACDKLDNKRCRLCDGANCNAISPDELNNFASKLAFDLKLVALVAVVMFMVVYGVEIS